MDKNDIRIGDEVEGVFRGVVKRKNGNFATLHTGRSVLYEDISRVLAREENKDDKIARLEARVAELEEQNGELAQGQLSRYRQRFSSMAEAWAKEPSEVRVIPASNKPRRDFCSGKKKKLWYPKRVKGYGPWIEGQPTEEVRLSSTFQILYKDERRDRKYAHLDYQPGRYFALENAVAYCIKED